MKFPKIFRILAPFGFVFALVSCDGCDESNPASPSKGNVISDLKESINDVRAQDKIPSRINGVELTQIHGWLANIYSFWHYDPQTSTVHPVPLLWTPLQQQNFLQILDQSKQLNQYGSGGDILEFNPNPTHNEISYWKANYFNNGSRPFFVLYEHINGTRYSCPDDCSKDMNLEYNRQVFREDIDYIFKNVITPNQSRYITVNGRAVIYMWYGPSMKGDFASLLEEIKAKYPLFFITSGIWGQISASNDLKAWDGFMEYTLGGSRNSYLSTIQSYANASSRWSYSLRKLESETGKRFIFIPTFQAAYDDSKAPGRSTPVMYPRTKEEMEYHAELIRGGMGNTYDNIGPFVVYSEMFEGAAVIESQCLPETQNRPGRYTGCGTGRLEILKNFFGR